MKINDLLDLKGFFAPTYKKLGWFFLVFFVAQIYLYIIMPFVPTTILQEFINFLLNPATIIFSKSIGIENNLAMPIASTINIMWAYFVATILVKELGKD
jgi:hypothetical protein